MKILIAGDFYPSERVKKIIDEGTYEHVFGEVEPIVKSADYAIVNYESPVVLGNYKPIVKCGPNLASSEKAIEAIKWAGFDMATLANNHIYDFGKEGLDDTIRTCEKLDVDIVGVGLNLAESQNVFYKEIQGKILAIINCCEHEFSIAGVDTPGANPLNPVQQYYQIREARKKADYVLVIVHGGHEHFQLPSPRMVETYRFFVDAGADAVVNHHQHCYSGYEVYNGKPIFYGLGNFCFDNAARIGTVWNEGFILQLDFEWERPQYTLFPYIQCRENVSVRLLYKNEADVFFKKIEQLNHIIMDKKKLQTAVKQNYRLFYNMYKFVLEPYSGRIAFKLYSWGLLPTFFKKKKILENHVSCESHRDRLLSFLEK